MAKQKFSLKNAEQVRQTTTMSQQKEIKRLYEQLYQDVTRKVGQLGNNNLQKQNLILLQRDIKNRIAQLNSDIQNGIIRDMRIVSNEVVEDTRTFLKQCGFRDEDIHNAFSYVPDQIIRNITSGNVYQDGWTLSGAIWGYNKRTQEDLNKIISIGTTQGKSAVEIARELEQYVDPSARKSAKTIQSWRYDKVGNKTKDSVYFGKIDYNALRLARTLISHAYQQSFENVNRNDPFVVGYRWLTSNFHGRVCEICRARAETDQFGLGVGVFPKDQLPLDHPNGMCTFEAVIPDSMTDIARKIGQWYQAPIGTYPDIDKYALDFIT
jgi:hypothetical protein